MEINIGMSRETLAKFARELLEACGQTDGGIEVTRYVQPNGSGPELTLVFSNDDMENRDDIPVDAAYWEQED